MSAKLSEGSLHMSRLGYMSSVEFRPCDDCNHEFFMSAGDFGHPSKSPISGIKFCTVSRDSAKPIDFRGEGEGLSRGPNSDKI